jgi:hypothetical protein
MIHELKIWPEPFELIRIGAKTFEVRQERSTSTGGQRFEGGDVLRLREWNPQPWGSGRYTGRVLDVRVMEILRLYETPPEWNIDRAPVVVMGFRLLTDSAFTRAALAEETGPGSES